MDINYNSKSKIYENVDQTNTKQTINRSNMEPKQPQK